MLFNSKIFLIATLVFVFSFHCFAVSRDVSQPKTSPRFHKNKTGTYKTVCSKACTSICGKRDQASQARLKRIATNMAALMVEAAKDSGCSIQCSLQDTDCLEQTLMGCLQSKKSIMNFLNFLEKQMANGYITVKKYFEDNLKAEVLSVLQYPASLIKLKGKASLLKKIHSNLSKIELNRPTEYIRAHAEGFKKVVKECGLLDDNAFLETIVAGGNTSYRLVVCPGMILAASRGAHKKLKMDRKDARKYLTFVLAHEMGHAIDSKSVNKVNACYHNFNKGNTCTRLPAKFYREFQADVWGALFTNWMAKNPGKDHFRFFRTNLEFLCGTQQGNVHADGHTRVNHIYKIPVIRSVAECSSGRTSRNFPCKPACLK